VPGFKSTQDAKNRTICCSLNPPQDSGSFILVEVHTRVAVDHIHYIF